MKKYLKATALTKENLIQAFWSLYCQKKIDHITIQEITDKAGYHRSTFYEYFVDIYDVLNQLEESLLASIQESVANGLAVLQNEDFVRRLADLYESQGKYLSVLLGESGDPYFLNKIKTVMLPVLTDTYGLSENEIHTSYIFEFATSGIFSTVTHWYKNGKNLPSQELVGLIHAMLTSGVFPMLQKYSNVS